jgi:NhaP-type Na+/H+ or K+/H+ antiporter
MFTAVNDNDVLKQSEKMWNGMEPELLLFMFLPALLFGEAMSLNFHHVRGAVIPAAILAGPGALFGAFFMALLVKYLLPYNWDWSLCLLFGCILCATDPVGKSIYSFLFICL